jgi:hypothetical protein
MSLCLQQPLPPVPEDTARVARAACARGNPYVRFCQGHRQLAGIWLAVADRADKRAE